MTKIKSSGEPWGSRAELHNECTKTAIPRGAMRAKLVRRIMAPQRSAVGRKVHQPIFHTPFDFDRP